MGAWMPIWMHTVWRYKHDSTPLQFIYILAARIGYTNMCLRSRQKIEKAGECVFYSLRTNHEGCLCRSQEVVRCLIRIVRCLIGSKIFVFVLHSRQKIERTGECKFL